MKVIYQDNVSGVSADSADDDYPASYLQTDYVKEAWKAVDGTNEATITAAVNGGSSCALFGTNATSVQVKVRAGLSVEWGDISDGEDPPTWGDIDSGAPAWYTDEGEFISSVFSLTESSVGSFWADFDVTDYSFVLEIHLTAPAGETVFAGVLVCGDVYEFNNPLYGLREGLRDYTIVRELTAGGRYVVDRDRVRTFDFETLMARDTVLHNYLHRTARANGKNPVAWYLVDDAGWPWVVYAAFEDMPMAVHDYISYCMVSTSITEAV